MVRMSTFENFYAFSMFLDNDEDTYKAKPLATPPTRALNNNTMVNQQPRRTASMIVIHIH